MNRSKFAAALLLGTALTVLSIPAMAEDEDEGFTAGSILIRARALGVITDTTNSSVNVDNKALGVSNIGPGTRINTSDTAIPELDASYFFTPNIAVEVIAGTARAALTANNSSVVQSVQKSSGNLDLGNTWILPPTITAQWHFLPKFWFNPYAGAGLNYTWFYNIQGGSANGGNLKLAPALGYALQMGADVHLGGHWYGNFDVKKIFLETNAHSDVTGGGFAGGIGTLSVTHVRLDPWLIGAGIGYRF